MRTGRHTLLAVIAAGLLTVSLSGAATAAEFVVVAASRGPIRSAATANSTLVTAVEKGTRLEVVAKAGDWYRVLLPPDKQGTRLSGYIQASLVTAEGAKPASPAAQTSTGKPAGTPAKPGTGTKKPSRYTLRGIGAVEIERFQAKNSFNAIFGSAIGFLYGGGAEVSIGSEWFVQGRLSHWSKTGERVYEHEGDVSRLGITETATMTPIDVAAGYRFASQPHFTPYAGGGFGVVRYDEDSAASDPSDASKGTFLSYHVAGGIEVPLVKKWLSVAGEVQYRGVPGAIGSGGVSKLFGETNLGGLSACVKVLIGPQPPRKAKPVKPARPPAKPPAPKREGIE
jgi:opacity protein-like surface antigen